MIIFSQRDKRWKDKKLGFSDVTIGSHGCVVDCLAMIATECGKDTDPDRMNEDLKKVNGFSGGYYKWGSLTEIYPDIKYTKAVKTPEPLTANQFKEINDHLSKGLVMLEVDSNPNTAAVEGHFVLALFETERTYRIADPWTGRECLLSKYGTAKYTIQRYVLYEGVAPVEPKNESGCFKECFITQAHRWPNEEETKEWEKSDNPVYAFVQNNAPNPIKEELVRTKDKVRTLDETIGKLRTEMISKGGKWKEAGKRLAGDITRLEGELKSTGESIEEKDTQIDELINRMVASATNWTREKKILEDAVENQNQIIYNEVKLSRLTGWGLILEGCRKLMGGGKG